MSMISTTPSVAKLTNVIEFYTAAQTLLDAPEGQERMACFHGPSGWGKSTAVSVAEIGLDAVSVEVPESVTKRFLLERICKVMGVKPKGSIPDLVELIAGQLVKYPRPLIIDDAQYLCRSRDMIGLTRDIYNGAGRFVPVILVGEEELPTALTAIENLHSRISVWLPAQPCEINDAWQLADIYAPNITIAEDLMAKIVEVSSGSARTVNNNLLKLRQVAASSGKREVDLALWGDRPFADGGVPAARNPQDLRPKVRLVQKAPLRSVAK
jgi:hypothetical protein